MNIICEDNGLKFEGIVCGQRAVNNFIPPFQLIKRDTYFSLIDAKENVATINFGDISDINLCGSVYEEIEAFENALNAIILQYNSISSDEVLNNSGVEGNNVTEALDNAKEISWFSTTGDFPVTGELERMYVSRATSLMYRWDGATYVLVGDGTGVGGTDLSLGLRKADVLDIDSSTGASVEVPFATTTLAGLMQAVDKQKLDGISTGANNYVHPNHSGDVVSVGDGATTIQAGVVSNTKLANMSAHTLKGKPDAGSGSPSDINIAADRIVGRLAGGDITGLTPSQVSTLLGVAVERDNFVLVKSKTDLPTPVAGVITLAANTTYSLNGAINLGTDHIVTSTSNWITGLDKSNDGLIYTGTGAAIRSTNQDLSLRQFFVSAPTAGGSAIALQGDGTNNLEVAELIFSNCNSVGTITGGFDVYVLRNNFATNCAGGLVITGTGDDLFFTDNVFKDFTGTGTMLSIPSGAVSVGLIRGNHFEVSAGQTAINIGAGVTINNVIEILSNTVTGAGTGLSGINANSSNVIIPPKSNFGIAGLFEGARTIVLGTLSSTTSGVWLSVTQQIITEDSYDKYEVGATTLRGKLVVGMTHDASAGSVGVRLFNFTDGVAVAGSTNSPVSITTGGVYQVVETPEVDIDLNKEYRVQIIKNSGTGGQAVYINAGDLKLKAF